MKKKTLKSLCRGLDHLFKNVVLFLMAFSGKIKNDYFISITPPQSSLCHSWGTVGVLCGASELDEDHTNRERPKSKFVDCKILKQNLK